MSAEFEKVVLEKLDILTEKVDSNSEAISTLTEKVDTNSEKISTLTEIVNSNSEAISALSEKVDSNSEKTSTLTEKVDGNFDAISTLAEKMNALTQKVNDQSLNFARFEHEFNTKIQALFDSFVANNESHTSFSKFISTLNAESFRHDVRISALEDLNKNTKLFAHN